MAVKCDHQKLQETIPITLDSQKTFAQKKL